MTEFFNQSNNNCPKITGSSHEYKISQLYSLIFLIIVLNSSVSFSLSSKELFKYVYKDNSSMFILFLISIIESKIYNKNKGTDLLYLKLMNLYLPIFKSS